MRIGSGGKVRGLALAASTRRPSPTPRGTLGGGSCSFDPAATAGAALFSSPFRSLRWLPHSYTLSPDTSQPHLRRS